MGKVNMVLKKRENKVLAFSHQRKVIRWTGSGEGEGEGGTAAGEEDQMLLGRRLGQGLERRNTGEAGP